MTASGVCGSDTIQRTKNEVKDQKWHRRCDYELQNYLVNGGKKTKRNKHHTKFPRDVFFSCSIQTNELHNQPLAIARIRVSSDSDTVDCTLEVWFLFACFGSRFDFDVFDSIWNVSMLVPQLRFNVQINFRQFDGCTKKCSLSCHIHHTLLYYLNYSVDKLMVNVANNHVRQKIAHIHSTTKF